MPRATGDFLFFLDSDDTLTPGALRAIADRLEESRDPDVLVFDYARTYWWGGTRRNALARVLAEAGDATFAAVGRPEILELLMVVWNKVYRRDYVTAHGFCFPPGYYEDTPWTFPVLLTARRIAVLDRICLNYRQRRQGNILSTTSRKHFDIHDQYERVFAYVDTHPELNRWRPYLRHKMGEHCLDILAKPDRLPAAAKGDFFRRTTELFHRHRTQETVPAELRILEKSYAGYRTRQRAAGVGDALGRRGWQIRGVVAGRVKRGWSWAHEQRALDPNLAVYSAFSHRGVLGDPAAIHRAALDLAPHIRSVWVVREDQAEHLPPGIEYVLPDTLACRRVTARATFFVNNVNWPGTVVKRPGSVHIHTHQGTPLKYMGTDLLGKPGARQGFDVPQMLRRADRWDYSLVANRHSELVWDRAYPCHFASARTGSPRNDVLVNAKPSDGTAFRLRHGIPADNTVVLYAPTRRDHVRGGHVERFDLVRFAEELGEDHTLVVRLHPSLADGPARGMGLAELHRRGVVVDATDEPQIEEVMLASDALVTDYSALMFDYANLDRPIVVHADDWGAYTASRGAYFDITAGAPGHVSRSYRELAWLFASGCWRDTDSAELRSRFRARFCEFDDGLAAQRVVRTLMLDEPDVPPSIPAPAAGESDVLTWT
jgi:CDP-glycerol glycerophosphotransferase (TagB/SpsB family)